MLSPRLLQALLASLAALLLSAPPAMAASAQESIQITEREQAFDITVPVSRITLHLPKGEFKRSSPAVNGGAVASPRYFMIRDDGRKITISGWFEPASQFKSVKEPPVASHQGEPLPHSNVVFEKIGDWDVVHYDTSFKGATWANIQAHLLRADTWVELHLSTESGISIAEQHTRLLEALRSLQIEEKQAAAAQPEISPADAVSVYLVPLDDFPEALAANLAKALQERFKLRVKASLRLPPLNLNVLPGTNQYIGEDILALGAAAAVTPEASPSTYRVFLTSRDINSRSGNFRFQFSMHNRSLNSSVISMARLLDYVDQRSVFNERATARLVKMTMRAIGEMQLGWSRSSDPDDLMFAPLMSLNDLDRTGFEHASKPKPVETFKLVGTTLLQPDFVLSQRVPAPEKLAQYIMQINTKLEERLKLLPQGAPTGGYIVVAVSPDGKSRVWLDFEPALPNALADTLVTTTQAVAPFRARNGIVVFGINISLWGGAGSAKQTPYPREWLEIAKRYPQPLEAGQLAELAWGRTNSLAPKQPQTPIGPNDTARKKTVRTI